MDSDRYHVSAIKKKKTKHLLSLRRLLNILMLIIFVFQNITEHSELQLKKKKRKEIKQSIRHFREQTFSL